MKQIIKVIVVLAVMAFIAANVFRESPEKLYSKGVDYHAAGNNTEAMKCFRKAAKQGYGTAQYYLGWCYSEGVMVTKDDKEAVKWFRKAAKQGVELVQFDLAICYYYGYGVKQDYKKAAKWFRKFLEQDEISSGHTFYAQKYLKECEEKLK